MNKYLCKLGLAALLVFTPLMSFAHGISEEDRLRMLSGGNLEYIWLGASHMVTGYDHLLFLLGVIFFLTKFADVVKFVTVFTIGHSITLTFATLLEITWNYWLVDALIAISVIYKGFDNNRGFQRRFDIEPPSLLKMVFLFGLIHGFGLSTRLQQLPLGEETSEVVWRILSFNLGVEFGQIAALAAMVILLSLWRHTHSFKKLSYIANLGLMVAGFYLLFMQLHGYQHDQLAEEFRFPEAEHAHMHEDMAIDQIYDESRHEL